MYEDQFMGWFWKVEIDWKAVVGIGIIVLGYAFIKLLAVMA